MSASLIGWILTLIIVVMLVCSVLIGLQRGLGKALFRFIWLVVFAVVLFFVTPIIANAINSIDISGLGLDVYGSVRYLSDIGTNLINNLAESNSAIANSEALLTLARNLPAIILSIPLYVLLFFITKWVFWPLYAIISSKIFNKQKRAQKKFKKEQARIAKQGGEATSEMPLELTVSKKKNRLGGAVIGLLTGLVMCIVTLMPLIGVNNIYKELANIKVVQEDGREVSLIESQINNPEVSEYLSFYENSIASKMLTYTGVGFVSNSMFNYLTTTKVNNQSISLSNEVSTVARAYDNISTLMNTDTSNLTQQKLDKILTATKELLVKAENSTLINVLGDDIIPVIIANYIDDENFELIDGGELDELIISSYKNFARNFNTKSLEYQLQNMIDVLLTLNNANIIVPLANGEVSSLNDVINLFGNNITTPNNFTNTVVNKLYEVTMLSNSYTNLVNNAVKGIFEGLEITDYNDQNIESATLKDSLHAILSNFITFAKYYSQATNMDFGDNTRYALESLGNTIDTLRSNIIGEDNYSSLLNFVTDKIKTSIIESADLQDDEAKVEAILNSLKQIENWGGQNGELYAINTLYSKIIKVVNTEITTEKFLDPNFTVIEEIGEGVSSAMYGDKSKIITNENIKNILSIVFNKIDKLDNKAISEFLNIKVHIKNNATQTDELKNIVLDNITNIKAEDWESEFEHNVAIFKKVYNILSGDVSKETLTQPNNTILKDIGVCLDNAKKANVSLIFTPATMRGIIEHFLEDYKAQFNVAEGTLYEDLPKELQILQTPYYSGYNVQTSLTVEQQLLNNIYNASSGESSIVSWETEFVRIKNILKADFSVTELQGLGRILDGIYGSSIFSRNIINSIVINNIDEVLENNNLETINAKYGAVDVIKKNLYNISSAIYEREFDYLDYLLNAIIGKDDDGNDIGYGSNLRLKLTTIGGAFDTIRGYKSVVLSEEALTAFLQYYFDDYVNHNEALASMDADLKEIINKINSEDNLKKINRYKDEFNHILNLADCLQGEINLVNVGNVLDGISKGVTGVQEPLGESKIITTSIIKELINYFITQKTTDINIKDSLKPAIALLQQNVNSDIQIISYEDEFYYIDELTKVINDSSVNYQTVGELLDKIKFGVTASGETQRKSSLLINTSVLNSFVSGYFDEIITNKLNEDDTELKEIAIKIKELATNPDNTERYSNRFNELLEIENTINNLKEIVNIESFADISANIGSSLDEMQNEMSVSNKEISYNLANVVVNKLKEVASSKQTEIDETLQQANFNSYLEGEIVNNYYSTLLQNIVTAISSN